MARTHYTAREYVDAARTQRSKLQELRETLDETRQKQEGRIAEVERELKATLQHLAALYLSDFTPETLWKAARRTRWGNTADQLLKARADEESALRTRLQALSQDDRVQHPNRYIHPEAGEFTRHAAEVRSFLEPWQNTVSRFEDHAVFRRLYERNYGTPQYAYKWWHPYYYRDWREHDELLEATGKPTLQALIDEYEKALQNRNQWRDSLREAEAQINEVKGLLSEQTNKIDRLERLDDQYLTEARGALIDHISGLAPAILVELAEDPLIVAQLTQLDALKAKKQYLSELIQERLEKDGQAIQNQLHSLDKKINKLSRPKHAGTMIPADRYDKRFGQDPTERYESRWQKVDHYSSTIYDFRDYNRGSLVGDLLWWDVMTDGRLDGSFLPGVHSWHDHHPDYHYHSHDHGHFDHGDTDDAVAAVLSDTGDVGGFFGDAS